jgi:hypothetical protein
MKQQEPFCFEQQRQKTSADLGGAQMTEVLLLVCLQTKKRLASGGAA